MKGIALLLAAIALNSCTTAYTQWQGGGVEVGPGGACEVKDGVEIWKMGAPPRPYRIIGIIEDDRPGAVIPMATRPAQIAAKAKEHGGDGVIIAGEREKYLGSFNSAQNFGTVSSAPWGANYSGSSFGTTAAITRAQSVFKVFKYVNAKPGPAH